MYRLLILCCIVLTHALHTADEYIQNKDLLFSLIEITAILERIHHQPLHPTEIKSVQDKIKEQKRVIFLYLETWNTKALPLLEELIQELITTISHEKKDDPTSEEILTQQLKIAQEILLEWTTIILHKELRVASILF